MYPGKWKDEIKDREGELALFLVVVDIKSNYALLIQMAFSVFWKYIKYPFIHTFL